MFPTGPCFKIIESDTKLYRGAVTTEQLGDGFWFAEKGERAKYYAKAKKELCNVTTQVNIYRIKEEIKLLDLSCVNTQTYFSQHCQLKDAFNKYVGRIAYFKGYDPKSKQCNGKVQTEYFHYFVSPYDHMIQIVGEWSVFDAVPNQVNFIKYL